MTVLKQRGGHLAHPAWHMRLLYGLPGLRHGGRLLSITPIGGINKSFLLACKLHLYKEDRPPEIGGFRRRELQILKRSAHEDGSSSRRGNWSITLHMLVSTLRATSKCDIMKSGKAGAESLV